VFELPKGWGFNCFLDPPITLSNYGQGVSYILYTYDLHYKFGQSPTIEQYNPQLFFHNSNIDCKLLEYWAKCTSLSTAHKIR